MSEKQNNKEQMKFGDDSLADIERYKKEGRVMIDYIASYMQNIEEYNSFPQVEPGYLVNSLPSSAPMKPETLESILSDVDRFILPGVTHWQHPHYHAFFPSASSIPGLYADMLANGLGVIGFSWASCPSLTELEIVMMDWLAKALNLPSYFLASEGSGGGGVIVNTTSEGTLVSLMAARNKKIDLICKTRPELTKYDVMSKLVAYHSDEAHCSVTRAGLICMIKMRPIPVNHQRQMCCETLQKLMEEDLKEGLLPFYVCATLGTTNSCAFDNVKEIGPICQEFDAWLHIDAAFAGSAFICPEFRPLMDGIEYADSFVFNAHKWLLVNFDCSCIWYKQVKHVVEAFNVDPIYLKYKFQGQVPDFRHWSISFGRKFRSLKIWFVFRMYGIEGLQDYIRKHVALGREMETLLKHNSLFEIVEKVHLSLVCFRLKGSDDLNKSYLDRIHNDGRIYLIPGGFHAPNETFFLRFSVNYQYSTSEHVTFAYNVLKDLATIHLSEYKENQSESQLC